MIEFVGPELFTLTECHFAFPGLIHLCVLLRFLGSGAKHDNIGDTVGFVKSTVCEILKELIPHVALKAKEMIKFPKDTDKLACIKFGFYKVRVQTFIYHVILSLNNSQSLKFDKNFVNFYLALI